MNKMKTSLRGLILRYTAACFSVAFVVICFLTPIYMIAYNNTQDLMLMDVTAQLSDALNELSNDIEYMRTSLVFNLKNDPNFQRLALSGNMSSNTYLTFKFHQVLNQSYLPYTVEDIIVTFSKNDILLMHGRAFMQSKYGYGTFFSFENFSFDQWKQALFVDKVPQYITSRISLYDDSAIPCFVLNYYYPDIARPSASFSIVLNSERILDSLVLPVIEEDGFMYITNPSDSILASYHYDGEPLVNNYSSGHVVIGDNLYTLLIIDSNVGNLRVVMGLPQSVFYENMKPFLWKGFLYIGTSLVLAIVLSVGYAYFSVSPIRPVLKQIMAMNRDTSFIDSCDNVFRYISGTLSQEAKRRANNENEIASLRKRQEDDLFSLLLNGSSIPTTYMKEIRMLRKAYVLILAHVSSFDGETKVSQMGVIRVVLENIFEEHFRNVYLHQGSFICAVVGVVDNGGVENIMCKLDITLARLRGLAPSTQIRFGVSAVHSNPDGVSVAYDQAGYCLQYLMSQTQEHVAQFDQLPPRINSIDFSAFEIFHHLLTVGDTQGVTQFFDTVLISSINHVVNTREQETTFRIIVNIFRSVLQKTHDPSEVLIYDYNPDINPLQIIEKHRETALNLCNIIDNSKRSHNYKMKEEIIAFISKNYSNPDLSLTMIGEHFKISQRYASQFIKEQTGRNYTTLIETIRLNQARRFLRECSVSISDVALMVGFDNKNTFYKAFKRRFNVSPMMYRSMELESATISKDTDLPNISGD